MLFSFLSIPDWTSHIPVLVCSPCTSLSTEDLKLARPSALFWTSVYLPPYSRMPLFSFLSFPFSRPLVFQVFTPGTYGEPQPHGCVPSRTVYYLVYRALSIISFFFCFGPWMFPGYPFSATDFYFSLYFLLFFPLLSCILSSILFLLLFQRLLSIDGSRPKSVVFFSLDLDFGFGF